MSLSKTSSLLLKMGSVFTDFIHHAPMPTTWRMQQPSWWLVLVLEPYVVAVRKSRLLGEFKTWIWLQNPAVYCWGLSGEDRTWGQEEMKLYFLLILRLLVEKKPSRAHTNLVYQTATCVELQLCCCICMMSMPSRWTGSSSSTDNWSRRKG